MGLLEKATREQKSAPSSETSRTNAVAEKRGLAARAEEARRNPERPSGLLKRAEQQKTQKSQHEEKSQSTQKSPVAKDSSQSQTSDSSLSSRSAQEGVRSPKTSRQSGGLLKRAEESRSQQQSTPDSRPKRGLLQRAQELKEKIKSGLFARAEQAREEDKQESIFSDMPELAELTKDVGGQSFDPTAEDYLETGSLDQAHDQSREQSQAHDQSQDQSKAIKSPEPSEDVGLDFPDLEYEGNSPPEADPAREEFGGISKEEDVFSQWEREAEREAEEHTALAVKSADTSAKKGFLFEDIDDSTVPVESHIASQKKIDNYLALFDITKDVAKADDFETLWDNILYAVMGQLGAETIAIFASTHNGDDGILMPVSSTGFELDPKMRFNHTDTIYERMREEGGVRYAEEFLNEGKLMPHEKAFIQQSQSYMVVSLRNIDQMYGLLFVGKPLNGGDYNSDDLEFMSLLGDIAALGVDRVRGRIQHVQETKDLKEKNDVFHRIFNALRETATIRNLDGIYDILARHLADDYGVESFSLVLLSAKDQEYKIFAGNRISPASIEKFKLKVQSDLIGTISNLVRLYDLRDFRSHVEITSSYTNDDLALMEYYWIIPLIHMDWLVGYITIHKTSFPWTNLQREWIVSSAEIFGPVFACAVMLTERESLFRDPFSPLEERLRLELKKASDFQANVSLIDIKVKNMRKILSLNPTDHVTRFLADLQSSIYGFLFETDFMARIGQGRFALVLPGRGKDEAEIFARKLLSDFKRIKFVSTSPIDVQYTYTITSAPADTTDPEKMLALLD